MFFVVADNLKLPASIEPVIESDYKRITKKRYSFNWKIEKGGSVYKLTLRGDSDILGLMSLVFFEDDVHFKAGVNIISVLSLHCLGLH